MTGFCSRIRVYSAASTILYIIHSYNGILLVFYDRYILPSLNLCSDCGPFVECLDMWGSIVEELGTS